MKLISFCGSHETDEDGVKAHIIETMGESVWTRLTQAFGGKELRTPSDVETLHPGHELAVVLGMDDACAFVRQFGGEKIYVRNPRPDTMKRYMAAIEDGLNNTEIADRFQISERAVRLFLQRTGIKNPNRRQQIARRSSQAFADEVSTVSNGGLTRLAPVSAPFSHSIPETRASGL